ncbi:hypothetical protein [Pandoravirus japonicus]|uniref:E3 ubiquitin-protein ligase TTC3/DZIP3 domain-containing protein n=1 Tax=Pandoravirus japonicus TaxID=2823154 RepID=A0A811BTD1_9VIRU|nr:hypothetical protein [Pandoravirus japonicus]
MGTSEDDDSDDTEYLVDSARDEIYERVCALVRARVPRRCLVDAHCLVAEIHGCYRPAWRTFAMAAAVTAAACDGLVGMRIPSGTRIVSAMAFHNPHASQADAAAHLSGLGAHSPITFDRLVVFLSWPSRSHSSGDLNWVAASLGSGPGCPKGGDGTRRNDHNDDGDDDECVIGVDGNGDLHSRAYSRPTSGLYSAVLQQATRITGECLQEAVSTLVSDPAFRKHHTVQRHSHALTVGWQYNVHDPTLVESVTPCPDGTLMRGCLHTVDPSCAVCDAVWANSEDLLPCARGTTRRVALRHAVRQAIASGIAIETTARVKAIPKAPPTPRRPVVMAAAAATTTKTTEPVVAATAAKGARAEAPSGPTGPRCGRALCPSRTGRVDTSTCASVRVCCTAGCRVIFHRACWRAVADRTLARGDESPCVTPDCWGLMASVVSLAPHRSGDATGRDARTKHVEWQTTASHGLDKRVRPRSSGTAPAIACRDRLDDAYVEREPQAPPTDTDDVEIDNVAARAVDAADADGPSVAVDGAHEPAETPVSLNVATRAYRKDRQQAETALCAKKARRTRTRTQKRQRVRARQKMGLGGLPAPVPWHGCDDQWPSFFVDDAAAPPLPSAQADADRPARPPTVWRFGTWHPPATRPS